MANQGGNLNVGSVVAYVEADLKGYRAGLSRAMVLTDTFGKRLERRLAHIGASFTFLGREMVKVGTIMSGLGIVGVKMFGNFERSMREATAVSDVTAVQFAKMSAMAEEASIALNKNATETAEAFYFLGSAGLTAEEQMQAFHTSTKFARAGVMDVGKATEILVDTIKGTGAEFKDTAYAADILTEAFTSSNTQLSELGESMSMVASIARETHTPLAEIAAVLGLMANVGIKGSRAGTAARRALVNLMDPSAEISKILRQWKVDVYDLEGRMKPFKQLVLELSDALKEATEKQRNHALATLFGVRAITGQLEVFRNSGRMLAEFVAQLDNAEGALDRVVDKQMMALLNQAGQVGRMLQSISRHIGATLEPELRGLVEALKPVVHYIRDWVDTNPILVRRVVKITLVVGGLTAALGTTTLALGSLAWSLHYLMPALRALILTIAPVLVKIALLGIAVYALRVAWDHDFLSMRTTIKKWADVTISQIDRVIKKLEPGGLAEFARNFTSFISATFKTFSDKEFWLPGGDLGDMWSRNFTDSYRKGLSNISKSAVAFSKMVKDDWADKFSRLGSAIAETLGKDVETVKGIIEETLPGLGEMLKLLKNVATFNVPPIPAQEPPKRGAFASGAAPVFASKPSWWRQALKNYYEDTVDTWPTVVDFMVDSMEQATSEITGSLSTMFQNTIKDFKNIEEFFNDFLQSISDTLTKMFSDIMAQYLMMKAIGMAPGMSGFLPTQSWGGAGWGGILGGMFAGGAGGAGGASTVAGATQVAPTALSTDFSWGSMMQMRANGGLLKGGFKAFATGGIINKPTLGLVGEGKYNEAVVPLPDGKSIPVDMPSPAPTLIFNISAWDGKSVIQTLKGHKRILTDLVYETASHDNHMMRRRR